jgi:hypothetical protein
MKLLLIVRLSWLQLVVLKISQVFCYKIMNLFFLVEVVVLISYIEVVCMFVLVFDEIYEPSDNLNFK